MATRPPGPLPRAAPLPPLEALSTPELVDLAEKVATNPRNRPATKRRVVDRILALVHARVTAA